MDSDSLHKFPEKLYLFMKAEYLKDCLEKDEIKVCLPSDCNDPFELMPEKVENKPAPDTEGVGFICFSQEWASSTMWAHYADKHKGVCLEFSFKESDDVVAVEAGENDNQEIYTDSAVLDLGNREQYTELPITVWPRFVPILMKVKYHPRRAYPASSQVRCTVSGTKIEDARFSRLYAAKGQEWSYEKEWRLFVALDNCMSYHDGCYFVKGLTKHISKIMLGWRCKMPLAYVKDIAAKPAPFAACVRMMPYSNCFAVREDTDAGQEEKEVPPVWRLNLEFNDEQWKVLSSAIKAGPEGKTVKDHGYEQALFNILKEQYNLPEAPQK